MELAKKDDRFISSVLAVAFLVLTLSYLSKSTCQENPWGPPKNNQYRLLCYTDAMALYHYRGLDSDKIPYVEQRRFEYPPLIGVQMWVTSYFSESITKYFRVHSIFNFFFALLTTVLLCGMVGQNRFRILLYAAGPPLFLHTFVNWDISTVFCTVLAIHFWQRRRLAWCGMALGAGISGKLYPLFALPPLTLALFLAGSNYKEKSIAIFKLTVGVAVGWVFFNLPFIVGDYLVNGNIKGWIQIFKFHAKRTPDFGSTWYWLAPLFDMSATAPSYRRLVDNVTPILLGLGMLWVLARMYLRKMTSPWAATAAVICFCLVTSKVHSPQYSLWLLPFFVLWLVPLRLVFLYYFADAILFVSGYWWFAGEGAPIAGPWATIFAGATIIRAMVLLLLGYWFGTKGLENIRT